MTEIKVPVFPESISEGTIVVWHKKSGDQVEEGDILAEIETDKVVMEVPAMAFGILSNIKKNEGDTVYSQEVIGDITDVENHKEVEQSEQVQLSVQPTSQKCIIITAPAFPESISEGTIASWHKNVGDLIEQGEILVEIETDKVMMEVPAIQNGILSKKLKNEGDTVLSTEIIAEISDNNDIDVIKHGQKTTILSNNHPTTRNHQIESNVLSPSVRRATKANDIDINNIKGSGKNGRITKKDIFNITPLEKSVNPNKQDSNIEVVEIDEINNRPQKRVPMTRLRQTLAKRLVDVQHTNAILTTFNEVDMKPVMDLRKQYKDLFQKTHNSKLGFMSFFLKAANEALKRFPEVNASISDKDIIYHGFFDIGVAVGTDRGLVVPVIRNVDHKPFAKIEDEIMEKAVKARSGKLSLEEMQGGTFTITNGGTYGSMLSTPIINAPQSAILGMHNIVERPVIVNGEIVIRPIMYLALSYDHRIIDGSVSVKFLKTIKELIEEPARILLEI